MRTFKRISNSCLRCKIDHYFWPEFVKQGVDSVSVSQIEFMEDKLVWAADMVKPRLFQIDIIITIQVIQASNFVTII